MDYVDTVLRLVMISWGLFFVVVVGHVAIRNIARNARIVRNQTRKTIERYPAEPGHSLPVEYAAFEEQAARRGFRLVEAEYTEFHVGGGALAAYFFINPEAFSYLNVSFDGTTTDIRHLEFRSAFQDESLIVTMHPIGVRVETPRFLAQFVRRDMETAWRYHQAAFAKWREQHGAPLPVTSSAEIRAIEALYNRRYRLRLLRGYLLFQAIGIVLLMPLLALAIALIGTEDFLAGAVLMVATFVSFIAARAYLRWMGEYYRHPPGAVDDAPPQGRG